MTNADETAIRTIIEDWAAAVRAVDMKGILANHTGDILMYDVPEPLLSRGTDAYRETWELFFRYSKGGPGSFDIVELAVTAGDTVAFATATLEIAKTQLRLTIGLRKEGGRWLIAHEHHSYPAKPGE